VALFWRVFSTMAAVNALCLLVLFSLASVQYDAVLFGLVRDRMAVVAQTLSEPFQAAAELGLAIESLRDVDALLIRAKQSSPDVLGIYLVDQAGKVVRSTEPILADGVARAAREALSGKEPSLWFGQISDAYLAASLIRSVDGGVAGGVLLEHGDGGRSLQVQALVGKLAFIASAILAISLALGIVILRFTLRGHIRVFDALLATYDRFERQAWRGVRADEVTPEPVRGFGIDTEEIFDLLEKSEAQYQAVNPSGTSLPAKGVTLGT